MKTTTRVNRREIEKKNKRKTARKSAKICGTYSWICQRHFPIFHYKYLVYIVWIYFEYYAHVILCVLFFFTWITAVSLTLIGHPTHPPTQKKNHVAHNEKATSRPCWEEKKKTQVNVVLSLSLVIAIEILIHIVYVYSDNSTIYIYSYNLFSFIACQKKLTLCARRRDLFVGDSWTNWKPAKDVSKREKEAERKREQERGKCITRNRTKIDLPKSSRTMINDMQLTWAPQMSSVIAMGFISPTHHPLPLPFLP